MTTVDNTDVQVDEEGFRSLDVTGETHDTDDGTHEVAVDYPHEVLDTYRTDWGKGCWDECFARRLPPMVWNHNADVLIGAGVRHEALGDRTRLIGRFADFESVAKAKEAYSLIKDKIVPGWSFHYRNGRTIPHPEIRGAKRFTKADMLEFGPVVFPSIPGASTASLRTAVLGLPGAAVVGMTQAPDLNAVLKLHEDGHLTDEGLRSILDEHFPRLREHIVVQQPVKSPEERIGELLDQHDPDLASHFRAVLIVPDNAVGGLADPGTDTEDDEDPTMLVQAIDAALDAFSDTLDGVDTAALPDPVQQAVALAQAAGVAVDELQEVMGIDDPDGPGDAARSEELLSDEEQEGCRAAGFSTKPWSSFSASDYSPAQWKSACLIDTGQGDPDSKDRYKLPVKEPDGSVNVNGVKAAASVLAGGRGGVQAPDEQKRSAAKTLVGYYNKAGLKPPPSLLSGTRSEETEQLLEGTLARLGRS